MDMEYDELQEILDEFHTEAEEGLDQLERDLIKLEAMAESGERDGETIDRIFRALHTLKGGAGFLGLDKMAKLAHAGENLLDEIRGGHCPIDTPAIDALLETNDLLKDLLASSRKREEPADVDTSALVARLELIAHPSATATAEAAAPEAEEAEVEAAPAPEESEPTAPAAIEVNEDLLAEVLADDRLSGDLDIGEDEPVSAAAVPADVEVDEDLLAEVLADDRLAGAPVDDVEVVEVEAFLPEATQAAEGEAEKPQKFERRAEEDRRQGREERRQASGRRDHDTKEVTIRVDTHRLDAVMNLVGELVLARNSLLRQMNREDVRQRLEELENVGIIDASLGLLTRITKDLQMSVLQTRMQPIKRVFDKIPRQVRELKSKLEKEVDLVIAGEDTEVDRSLVEELSDPMVHLIRNALDHGLEEAAERVELGKPATGKLVVRAFYEGNNVVIQVQDDGRGIDPERIRASAIKKGLIDEAAAANMPDAEAIRLVMAPGFSTAEQISDVSGRGVGMDVVNAKITGINGTIELTSEIGVGTTVSIYLPLTLAIVQALVVESCTEGFAIPITTISEVLKFRAEDVHQVQETDVIELRGEVLPLTYLGSLTRAQTAPNQSGGFIVVVRDGSLNMGLVVDKLIGQEEAVVKSITDAFEYNKAISGATISGDGNVHMILDVPYLMRELVESKKNFAMIARRQGDRQPRSLEG